jgi:serine/threonine-protein kinase
VKRCPECGSDFPLDAGFCPHDGKILVALPDESNPDPRLGARVGERFVLVAIVADGANGRVYEARETTTRTKYAVKILHPHAAEDPTLVERFKREADTARQIDHPNVLVVYDFGKDPVVGWYLAMEFLEGEDLGRLLAREAPLPTPRTLHILALVARALGAAHAKGIVHRDIKPENVFVVTGDDVRLLDFGSVKRQEETGPKLTSMGTTLGSPYYMSPEQAKGLPTVDPRADVFSLACIAYEMLTGKVAFTADNVAEILYRILSENPTPPSFVRHELPEAVDDAMRRALAKEPEDRTATPAELVRDLERSLGDAGISAAPAAPRSVPTLLWLALGVVGGVAIVGAIVVVVRLLG